MIGLVDYDIYQSKGFTLHPPNLEIMKLASYYKIEEHEFCRLVSLEETMLDGYDKIYFFSEDRNISIPESFKSAKNVIFGGSAFNNGIYKPFDNSLIDFSIPRSYLYKDFLNDKYRNGVKTREINSFLDSSYYRMYAGEEQLPLPVVKRNKKIYIYDTDFCKSNWKELIEKIEKRNPSSIKTIHPIICYSLDDFRFVRAHTKIRRDNDVILNFNKNCQDFNEILNKNKNYFLGEITKTSKVFLPFGGTKQTSFEYCRDLIEILNLLYLFWSKGIKIKLKYIYPNKGIINPIENLSLFIERWSNDFSSNKTLLEKIDKKKQEKEEFKLFMKFYSSQTFLFSQTYKMNEDRGYWKENGCVLH